MPRILVADDNSNIHRTVALALKEAGVEVVAVGNGEAAVRKIAEIKPDLVLADIFMPVRSGYEVCEFVKKDPRFAGVPVVLLVGAFDPFDEREAQRVQADGILKKPFVPADSLLRTVTDLLAQSASRAPQAPAAAAPARAERPSPPAPAPSIEPAAPQHADEEPEEFATAKPRLEWNSGEAPVAFGTLLETSAAGTDDAVLTSQRDPNLGEPVFWTSKAQPENEEGASEEESAAPAMGLVDEELLGAGTGLGGEPARAEAGSETGQANALLELEANYLELPELEAPAVSTTTETSAALPEATLELEAEQLPPLAFGSPADGIAAPSFDALPELPEFSTAGADAPESEPEEAAEPAAKSQEFGRRQPEEAGASPFSEAAEETHPKSEQEVIEAAAPALATLAPFLASLTSAAETRTSNEPDDLFALDSVPPPPEAFAGESIEEEPAERLDSVVPSQLDPAVIEAIAQRVIERMQPKIIELVTRELLRPAVEALVQRELEKK